MVRFLYSLRPIAALSTLAIALAVAGGCKKPEAQVVGGWTDPTGKGAVTFNADKTFTQTAPMAVTGKWSINEHKVSITIDTVMGKTMKEAIDAAKQAGATQAQIDGALKPIDFTLGDDGKTMTMTTPNGTKTTLTKQAAAS